MGNGWHDFTTLPAVDWPQEQARRIRNSKIERLLETVDLTTEDFLAWLSENGIKPTPRNENEE